MLRAAVEENADTIADRVPQPLRPGRRLFALWLSRARVLVIPAAIVGSMAAAHWTMTAEAEAVPPVAMAPLPSTTAVADVLPSPPDLKLLERPLSPRALALGVSRVVIDAGHGGAQQGTSSETGLLEKEVTLDLAERTRKLLEAKG